MASSYLVLKLDFSGISTVSQESTYADFATVVKAGMINFATAYPSVVSEKDLSRLGAEDSPTNLMRIFLAIVRKQPRKVYLLIDEYDHFTNELVSFDIDQFQEIVSKQGWVRKFYEVVKTGTGQGLIDRIFMTGVSPVTLDSLTSGFNIGKDLTRNRRFEGFMGFTDEEVADLLQAAGIYSDETHNLMRTWYNGYRFSDGNSQRMYNPDMVLYFATEYLSQQRMPTNLLDTNIASDYGKIKRIFRLGGEGSRHFEMLQKVMAEGRVSAQIVPQFSFERDFTPEDFLSLMFYTGLLTIKETKYQWSVLGIPNMVIEQLYFDFFRELIEDNLKKSSLGIDIQSAVIELSDHNHPEPLLKIVSDTLYQLSNRDFLHFNETSLKMVFLSYLHMAQIYTLRSEHEADRGYVDLLLLHRPPIDTPYQFTFELKYLNQKNAAQLEKATEEGRAQLQRYLNAEDLQTQPNLRAWLFVFVGTEMKVIEEVFANT
ncbi:MAG: AAA family ATPase [Bacteroidota bacterium]